MNLRPENRISTTLGASLLKPKLVFDASLREREVEGGGHRTYDTVRRLNQFSVANYAIIFHEQFFFGRLLTRPDNPWTGSS